MGTLGEILINGHEWFGSIDLRYDLYVVPMYIKTDSWQRID
jgi:hypothetical protein